MQYEKGNDDHDDTDDNVIECMVTQYENDYQNDRHHSNKN